MHNAPVRSLALLPLLALLAAAAPWAGAPAQEAPRRALTHQDYDAWRSIQGLTVSRDGSRIACSLSPQDGDPVLEVRDAEGELLHTHPRGRSPAFTPDGRFVVFQIAPAHEEMRAWRLARQRRSGGDRQEQEEPEAPAQEPRPSLGILDLTDGSATKVPRLRSFRVPEEGPSFVAYSQEREQRQGRREGRPARRPADRRRGHPMVLKDLSSDREVRLDLVTASGFTKQGDLFWFAGAFVEDGAAEGEAALDEERAEEGGEGAEDRPAAGVFALRLPSLERVAILEGAGEHRGFTFDRDQRRLAFHSDHGQEKVAGKEVHAVFLWERDGGPVRKVVSHAATAGFPGGRCVSTARSLSFSRDGSVLLLGAGPLPEEDPPPVLDEDRVRLELWHHGDPLIHPMAARRARSASGSVLDLVWHVQERRLVPVGVAEGAPVRFLTPDGSLALALTNEPYAREITWDGRYHDVYAINTLDGSRRRVLERHRGGVSSSPGGRHLLYFGDDLHWHAVDTATLEHRNLTEGLGVRWEREDWDRPEPARPHGTAGWTEGDAEVLLQDRHDLWRVRPGGGPAVNLTRGYGRANDLQLRLVRLDADEDYVDLSQPLLLHAVHLETMATGYFHGDGEGVARPRKLVMEDKSFGGLQSPPGSDRVFFTLSTFRDFPDVWTAAADFTAMRRLTHANPQQDGFQWGTAELVRWHSADGIPLKGVLVKPDTFDPSRRHPMLVHIYERRSQGLHRHFSPSPGASPNPSYYASNGWLFFMPDIVYTIGEPGPSAFRCVVPGVLELVSRGWVDEDAIGIAGHSWGGYQTCDLITRTGLFRAAQAGAPVSNMVSAYGGIRWSTGMARAFQYEQSQSRIGGSIWEKPFHYIENSPIFQADRIRTPLLMLHNDEDGAVPWQQGIELFVALRRLGSEVYMLNYTGEGHSVRRRANQKDWTVRMQEFFDHHLRGAEAPEWMREGLPPGEPVEDAVPPRAPRAVPVEAAGPRSPEETDTRPCNETSVF